MKIFNLTILAVLILLMSNCAFIKKIDTHPLKVDSFETKNGSVEVIFYEPLNNVKQVFPQITSNNLSELEKAELWDKYLQTHALYIYLNLPQKIPMKSPITVFEEVKRKKIPLIFIKLK
jgi:hypothetical protein